MYVSYAYHTFTDIWISRMSRFQHGQYPSNWSCWMVPGTVDPNV